jgi:diadenosine tetraphosphate (Ap4A) HIT family hydrolase
MNKSGLDLKNARSKEYADAMKKIITDEVCPFCHDFVEKAIPAYHPNPIIVENDSWVATRNGWPYANTKEHLIFVIKRHIYTPEEMTEKEMLDFWDIVKQSKQQLEITHSTIFMRSASTGKTGATVRHLHAQMVVSSGEGPIVTAIG